MSTNGYELQRAVVYSVDTVSGVTMVKLPALLGNDIVPIPPEGLPLNGGVFALPSIGDIRMVAVSPDMNHYSWVVGADASAIWNQAFNTSTGLSASVTAGLATKQPLDADLTVDANTLIEELTNRIALLIRENAVLAVMLRQTPPEESITP